MNSMRGCAPIWLIIFALYSGFPFSTGFNRLIHSQEADAKFDLVIRNAKIVDGSGNPWFYGSIAVNGERIAKIGTVRLDAGRREIDAHGLIVAPGFIDIHSHSDTLLLEDGTAQSKIRQGVTTDVLGEGDSMGPFQGKANARSFPVDGEVVEVRTLDDYFKLLESSKISINVASYVGLNNVWRSVMGDSFDRPTEAQLQEMESLVDEAMKQGALGLSSQVMMPPGSLVTTEEIIRLCKIVAPYGGLYSTHIRNEGDGVIESVTEAIEIGRQASVAVDVIHLKIADEALWGRMSEVVGLIDKAREAGVNVQANVYPYTRGNNNLSSIIPPWAHEGGREETLRRLKDPKDRQRIKHDIEHGVAGWYNHYTAVGRDWSRMLVSGDNRYKGLTMERVMALRTEGRQNPDLLDELLDLLIEEGGSVGTVFAHHNEHDMNLALQQPWCSVGSDGSAYAIEGQLRRGNPHPRNFGTFPRVLGVYVRSQHLLRLEDAIRKMTHLNAAKIGLRDRGLLVEGFYADLTIFHPERVIDLATYTDPFQYPDGIKYVVVNGQIVLDHGKHTGALPGKAIRHKP